MMSKDKTSRCKMPKWEVEEDVVISGISGRYPESENVEEFKKNLFDGVDMVTDDDRRWRAGVFGTPKGLGKLKNLDRFDHLFFEVHGRQANAMDPAQRIVLEAVYEAIFDSGYSPFSLSGKNIGVYVGCCGSSIPEPDFTTDSATGYDALGTSMAMTANRINFTFDFQGPSVCMDAACSSSLYALDEALLAIRTGRCEAAIVAGCSVILKFHRTGQVNDLTILSPEGRSKSFDASANGYARAEAVCAVFLQRASAARRVYATILHCKVNNDGKKPQGITFPSREVQKKLAREVYEELEMSPSCLSYLEAHGAGSTVGDPEEGGAIGDFFCEDRSEPLLLGSTKSNCGHAEGASGVVSLTKVLISMEEGMIPANLNFKEPNPKIPALLDGRIKIVSEHTPFTGEFMGISNFGYGGCNVHIVLRSNKSPKYEPAGVRLVPRLALSCGRTEQSVRHILQTVYEKNFNDDAVTLLEEASKTSPQRMRYRGFTLLQNTDNRNEDRYCIRECERENKPIWFVYSGMGSQWSGMARDMMKLEPFAKSIYASAEILKPVGVDLLHLLTTTSEEELNHIVAPFVTIAAVQIALTDLLRLLGIQPQGIVGHSVGELGCSYADGSFTARQMLMAAYWRGKSCEMTELIYGKMAAVGMTWEEATRRCPEGVFPVCHNAEDSVTISGPAQKVQEFLRQLQEETIFTREVQTGDIAFHCKYVEPAAQIMRRELKKLVPNPKARSHLWISSSVPEDKWESEEAMLSSVDYHTNNLLSPVLFKEAMSHVPKNALVIEIAPHCLLRPIIQRNMANDSIYIGLMNKREENNLEYFLRSIGTLYNIGLNPAVRNLYAPVTFPVPRGTPMLNSLIIWDPNVICNTWNFMKGHENKDAIEIETHKKSPYEFILDHKVDGRVLFPATGYLWLAWKELGRRYLLVPEDLPVVFEDVRFRMASVLPKSGVFTFQVSVMDGTGTFSIFESGSLLVSGTVKKDEDSTISIPILPESLKQSENEVFTVDAHSFYKELRLRGYEYGKAFQGVTESQSNGLQGKVKWEGNWISFMDSSLQIGALLQPERAFVLPTRLRRARIDPRKTPETLGEEVPAVFNPWTNQIVCGPVEIQGLQCLFAPRKPLREGTVILEENVFIPYNSDNAFSNKEESKIQEYIRVCSTLASKAVKHIGRNSLLNYVSNGNPEEKDDVVQKYLNTEQENHMLIKVFQKILSHSDNNVKNAEVHLNDVTHHTDNRGLLMDSKFFLSLLEEHDLSGDLVSRLPLTEHVLREMFSMIRDNYGMVLKEVMEISHCETVKQDVERIMKTAHAELEVGTYTIVRTSSKPVLVSDLSHPGTLEAKVIQANPQDLSLPGNQDLIITKDIFTKNILSLNRHVKTIARSIKEMGFLLFIERTNITPAEKILELLTGLNSHGQKELVLEEAFAKENLSLIAKRKDKSTFVMYLLRKTSRIVLEEPLVFYLDEKQDYKWVEDLKETLKENEYTKEKQNVWVVSHNPKSGVVGLLNALRCEDGGARLRFYFDASLPGDIKCPEFKLHDPLIQELLKKDLRSNVFRRGEWGFFGSQSLPEEPEEVQSKSSSLGMTDRGNFSSFRWMVSPMKFRKPENEAKVCVYYSALNFHDVMIASGQLHTSMFEDYKTVLEEREFRFGCEFSGIEVETGRRVMGVMNGRCLANVLYCPKDVLLDVPSNWTMEEACTVLIVYFTAYYSLIMRGKLKGGEIVLIHSGSGGVGQAAIAICLDLGCRVYTTVGTEEKKEFLLKRFPALNKEDIYNSRTLDFETEILNKTRGQGVDLVLNSLAGEKLQASVRCLRLNGKFIEIGKYDMFMDSSLGMSHFRKNIDFQGIALGSDIRHLQPKAFKKLMSLILDGVRKGIVQPLKANVFPWDKTSDAFRFMASGKHIGKVVVKIRDENDPTSFEDHVIPSLPRTFFNPCNSVVVTGGLGGLGFELCHWLVSKGVRHLVISSRTGVKNNYQKLWVQKWIERGIQIEINNEDITDIDGCRNLLNSAKAIAPVGSIFHLAMVLHDGMFSNLKPEDFMEVCGPKVDGAKNLDTASRELCPELENFCVFSSIIASKGFPGLSNYAYANSAMERIVEHRRAEGLPGQAIEWGPVDQVGIVYEKYQSLFYASSRAKVLVSQTPDSCFSVLDRLLCENHPISASYVLSGISASDFDPKKNLVSQLCTILGIKNPESLSPETTLGNLGMDSLMTVEAKRVLETEFDVVMSAPEILKLTIKQIEAISEGISSGKDKQVSSQRK